MDRSLTKRYQKESVAQKRAKELKDAVERRNRMRHLMLVGKPREALRV